MALSPRGMTIDIPDDEGDLTVHDSNESPRPRRALNGNDANKDVGFNELKAQLDSVTRKADTAEQRAANAEAQARRDREEASRARDDAKAARGEGIEGRRVAIDTAIAASKAALDSLESEYTAAFEAGDSKKLATIQRRMSETAADVKQLESGKAALGGDDDGGGGTRRTTEGRVERKVEERRQPQTEDEKFDAYVTQFGPEAEVWLRKHPETVTNQQKNKMLLSAHWEAEAQGYTANTPAYFAYLDRKMGYHADRAADDISRDNPIDDGGRADNRDNDRQPRGAPMRSAPVSRNNGSGGRSSGVDLSPGEVDAATDGSIVWNKGNTDHRGVIIGDNDPRLGQPIGEYEMARRKKVMSREGRYAVPYAS